MKSKRKASPKSMKKGSKNRAQEGYPVGFGAPPDGVPQGSRAKKSKPNAYLTKKTRASNAVPPFYPKKWPTWPQVGSQVGAKMDKKSIQKSIKKLMLPGIGFWKDFGGFWEGKWSQVGTKIHCKLISVSKRLF